MGDFICGALGLLLFIGVVFVSTGIAVESSMGKILTQCEKVGTVIIRKEVIECRIRDSPLIIKTPN